MLFFIFFISFAFAKLLKDLIGACSGQSGSAAYQHSDNDIVGGHKLRRSKEYKNAESYPQQALNQRNYPEIFLLALGYDLLIERNQKVNQSCNARYNYYFHIFLPHPERLIIS